MLSSIGLGYIRLTFFVDVSLPNKERLPHNADATNAKLEKFGFILWFDCLIEIFLKCERLLDSRQQELPLSVPEHTTQMACGRIPFRL